VSRPSRHRSRHLGQAKLRRTIITKPDDDVRRVGPKECIYFARHLQGFIYAEPLQGLNVKNTIVEITVNAFFAMNTLALPIRLSSHDVSPYPRAGKREKQIH
jgi:hypothetical protein